MPLPWTDAEVQFTRENWKILPKAEIASRLGKTLYAVTTYAYRHGWSQHAPASTYQHLTEAEKAYIAGIVDGEGHIEIGIGRGRTSKPARYTVSVVISNTDYGLLDWLQRRLPGSYINERVHGKNRKPHWKPAWTLRLHRRGSVLSLLTELLPYLIVKRTRALEAMTAIRGIRSQQWR